MSGRPRPRVWRAGDTPRTPVSAWVPKPLEEKCCNSPTNGVDSAPIDMKTQLRKEVDIMRAALKGAIRGCEEHLVRLRHYEGQLEGLDQRLETYTVE